jgi:hypothetical protein
MRKLYKAKVTAVVYFQSEESDPQKLSVLAEKYLLKELKSNGFKSFPEPERVRGYERPEGDWDENDFLWGSENRDGHTTLGIAMMEEQDRANERAGRAKQKALPPAKPRLPGKVGA